jgi:hypothetical protein
MRELIDQNFGKIQAACWIINIGIFLTFHGGILNWLAAIFILLIFLGPVFGLITNLIAPSRTRSQYINNRNDYGE